MPIYMKYGDLQGDVTQSGFEGWIEIDSFSWGVSQTITNPTGGGGSANRVNISDISVNKQLDKASVNLLASTSEGSLTAKVNIVFLKTEKDSAAFLKESAPYLQYQLNDTLVSSYSISSGGDRPTESLSLNFHKLQTTYTPQNGQGSSVTIGEHIDDPS